VPAEIDPTETKTNMKIIYKDIIADLEESVDQSKLTSDMIRAVYLVVDLLQPSFLMRFVIGNKCK
jgi:hypothetical protein